MDKNYEKYSVVLDGVSKFFGDEEVLKSVDLELEKGIVSPIIFIKFVL